MADAPQPDLPIYVVVVNWNRPADTKACLESLLAQENVSLQIILVDNGSTDDSVGFFQREFPQVQLIANPVNLRFAGGYNLGIRRALDCGAQRIFILNNDTVLATDALAVLVQSLAPGVGVLAPLIYYYDPPDLIWSMGGCIHPLTLEKTGDARKGRASSPLAPFIERDFVTGCGMLFTREVLDCVGLFDEAFLHYYEDMDLCRRIRQAGFHIGVIPAAKMWHKVAVSSGGSDSPSERYWMARSSVRYFWKHARGGQMAVVIPYRLGSAVKTTFRLLFARRLESIASYWRGLRDGWKDVH